MTADTPGVLSGSMKLLRNLSAVEILRPPRGSALAAVHAAAKGARSNAATIRFYSAKDLAPMSEEIALPPWNAGLVVMAEWVFGD